MKYLHKFGYAHRDIKPDNLLLTKDDIVKLADLGEAKNLLETIGHSYRGTIQYMSPEQSGGRQFDDQLNYSTHSLNTDVW